MPDTVENDAIRAHVKYQRLQQQWMQLGPKKRHGMVKRIASDLGTNAARVHGLAHWDQYGP